MLLLLSSLALAGDVDADIEAQLRPRYELDSVRGLPPGEGPVHFGAMRSRLGFQAQRDTLILRIVAQDVRTFGEETDTRRDYSADGLDLREAWVRWGTPNAHLSVGRFERGMYNERLIAIANWRPSGRSFDGAVFEANLSPTIALEARGFVLREGTPQVASADQAQRVGRDHAMGILTLRWVDDGKVVAPMVFIDGDGDVERLRTTSGVYSAFNLSRWSLEAEGYVQAGREGEQQILAGMVGANARRHLDAGGLGVSYELLSADANPSDDQRTSFNTLFGANHRHYGHIDMAMFYVGGFGDDQGLQDAELQAWWSPREGLTLSADLHAFVAALGVEDRLLAVEPDLYFKAGLTEGLTLSGGANLWIAPDPDEREWMGWLMLDAKLKARVAERGGVSSP